MKIIIDTGQDGKVINARVRQKTATLSQWLGKDPVILDGEQAFIIRDDGTPLNFRIGDGSKKFSELPDWIAYEQGTYAPVVGTALPNLGAEIRYTWVGPGTYTQTGGPAIVVPSGYMGVLSWDGSVWSLSQSVELPDNSAKIAELDRRVSFFDRPDLPYEHYLVGADMGVIDRLLSEKRDLDGLKPDGFSMYMIDRPDLGVIIIVDKDWRLISHTGQQGNGENVQETLYLQLWNPPAQTAFNIPTSGDDTILGNYDTLISEYDTIMSSANINPNISPYITKESLGQTKIDNHDIWKYSLKPSDYKLKVLLVAGTHANEKMYIWALHSFIKEIVENWQSHPFLEFLRWNVWIDVLPCRSPYTLSNDVRKRGFRVVPETPPIPFSWTKAGTTVTLTFDVNDFPGDGFLTGGDYFTHMSESALSEKTSFGVITSSDEVAVPLNAYRIGSVLSGNSITFTAPSGGATEGTGTFQVWTDPNRNWTYEDSTVVWDNFVGGTTIQPADAGNVIGFFDNKGTRPFSLVENRVFAELIETERYDHITDAHSPAADNDVRYVLDSGFTPNLERMKTETAAFNAGTFNFVDSTNSTQPIPGAIVPRRYGSNWFTIEWGSGLYDANETQVRDALRWMGITLKDAITGLINKK